MYRYLLMHYMLIVVLSVYVKHTTICVISYMNNAILNLKVFFRLTVTRRMSLVDKERPTFPEHLRSPPIVRGFVLLNLQFYVKCVVNPFCFFWSLFCLSVFDLRLLIDPLVSSNISFQLHNLIDQNKGLSYFNIKNSLHQIFSSWNKLYTMQRN